MGGGGRSSTEMASPVKTVAETSTAAKGAFLSSDGITEGHDAKWWPSSPEESQRALKGKVGQDLRLRGKL